jgi:hypothetical protein
MSQQQLSLRRFSRRAVVALLLVSGAVFAVNSISWAADPGSSSAPSPAEVLARSAAQPPIHIAAELKSARLAGIGTFRYFGLHIYDAQLWVDARGYRSDNPAVERFALDLKYARSLNGSKIAKSSIDEIKSLRLGTIEQRADWLGKMEKIFPDVKEGTHLTGIFIPRLGARFYADGRLLGEIADPEFGRSFFAIWLDPRTTAPVLREALLEDAAPRP